MTINPDFRAFDREMVVDLFAGGGGTSTGIEMALGYPPDYAVNHDPVALAVHAANHPDTIHLSKNVWKVDPLTAIPPGPIGLLWMSPDCRHFSKAAGGALRNAKVRDLAWVALRWAKARRPRIIMLENVMEFLTWGPLGKDGQPIKARHGETFRRWKRKLEAQGYVVEHRTSRASAYGAPTIRNRLCVIARCDGLPIVWPAQTFAPALDLQVQAGHMTAYRTAADCIDWSLPCPSIFMSEDECEKWFELTGQRVQRPLADNTMARIAAGLKRFVFDDPNPFIVPIGYGEREGQAPRTHGIHEPLPTQVGAAKHALVTPFISHAQQGGRSRPIREPLHTLCASPKDQNQLVMAFLAQHNLGAVGHRIKEPVSTITVRGTQQTIMAAHLLNMKGGGPRGHVSAHGLVPTLCAGGQHVAPVMAFLIKYFGTAVGQSVNDPMHTDTVKPRFGLVMVKGEPYQLVDIGMRMLTVAERFAAQGFPRSYKLHVHYQGKPVPNVKLGALCGNSVSPPWAAAHVAANYQPRAVALAA